MYSADIKDLDLERLKKSETFPHPTGYKLLIAMPTLEEKLRAAFLFLIVYSS